MPILTQRDRSVAIGTPLGEDILLLHSMKGTETLGRLFAFELELVKNADVEPINFDDIVGQNVSIRLETGEAPRYFNGYISEFSETDAAVQGARCKAVMVPWLWFLTQASDCRIFQKKSVPEIVEEVFKAHGFDKYDLRLSGSYDKLEYRVQYRESDFNFVSRLMEEVGIYYFFVHEEGEHTLVLADSSGAHESAPGVFKDIEYLPAGEMPTELGHAVEWSKCKRVRTTGYAHTDFDFKKPKTQLMSKSQIPRSHAAAGMEWYDYPGRFLTTGDGETLAKVRIEERQTPHDIAFGRVTSRGVHCGHTFRLLDYPGPSDECDYLAVSTTHHIVSDMFSDTDTSGTDQPLYEGIVEVIEASTPFRSARMTPLPRIDGPQSAIVVGPSGEEIYTDKFGRVMVQFHWDRDGKYDENSSCFVRVSQNWAGKKWGGFSLPRIGQEVIVDFLEGDPDQPIITGRVYNGESMPPYALPGDKTRSTLKSNSSIGGEGFNEIRFEDKKENEQIFIHAEKDEDHRVKNDSREWIGHDRHLVVENNQYEHVKNERHETIETDHIEEVGRDHHAKVRGKEAIEVTKVRSITVKDDVVEVFKKNQSTEVTKDLFIKADNIVIEGKTNVTIKVGSTSIAIDAKGIKLGTNGEIVLDAKKDITQKSLKNVTIESTNKMGIKGMAGVTVESPAQTTVKGTVAEVSASGVLTLKGALVKIN